MAYAINKNKINNELAHTIRSLLLMQAENQNSKYNKYAEPTEPILFYNIIEDTLHLPFIFAASLLKVNPNFDTKFPSVTLTFTGTLRENQVPVEIEAWDQLEKYGTTTLGLHPGFGKTILGAKLASRAKLLTVVLVHRTILTDQWKKTFTDYTNSTIWIVGEKKAPEKYDVIICMDTRWHLIPEQIRNNVGFLIIDEAHAFCTPTHVGCLLAFHPKYIVIESGSLERDDGLEKMIHAIAGTHGILRESNKVFSVIKIKTNTKPERRLDRFGNVDYTHLIRTTLMNERRNKIIIDLVVANKTFKILILTSLRDHATLLNDMINAKGITSDFLCGTKRGYQDSNVLVGTTSKIGTGFDPATSCPSYAGKPFDLLLLVCTMKKYSMLIQNVGRVFRAEYPTVMHFVDDDNIYVSHWGKARKWYASRGGVLSEHNIPNTEVFSLNPENVSSVQSSWIASRTKKP